MAGRVTGNRTGNKIIGLGPRPDRPAVHLMNVAGRSLVTLR
jgi:hypothetical protein